MELAEYRARKCHVLGDVTRWRDVDDFNSTSEEFECFGRYVDPVHSLSTMTNDIRTIHKIESTVNERRNITYDLRERYPGSTKECFITQRAELRTTLRTPDVRDYRSTVPTISELH